MNKNSLNNKDQDKKLIFFKNKDKLINLNSKNRNTRSTSNYRQQVVSITYEEIGLFPRSFNRVFDRFFKQLFFDVENLVIQEYRFYRYLFLTTVKCVFILICVPLTVNFFSKNYLIRPITEYYWNSQQPEIFLNSYMQKRSFNELKDFEEKIYFESLIQSSFSRPITSNKVLHFNNTNNHSNEGTKLNSITKNIENEFKPQQMIFHSKNGVQNQSFSGLVFINANTNDFSHISQMNTLFTRQLPSFGNKAYVNVNTKQIEDMAQLISKDLSISDRKFSSNMDINYNNIENSQQKNFSTFIDTDIQKFGIQFNEYIQKCVQKKILELANHYNEESIEAITNFFADFISLTTLWFLLLNLEIQMNITKSFLLEVFFGLDDSKKSLLILFITDLLVGYHSPNIWELFFSSLFDHYGLPENQTTIFLLVATLPVLLDVLFKYLIFRHLNRASPATVATYHAMIE
jgi:hypothetical protein